MQLSARHSGASYDSIGHGYAGLRREDSRIYHEILEGLGDSKSVINIGAGAGSYEPRDRMVLGVEPSAVMANQRGPDRTPAIKASSENLPFHDKTFDAAMTVLSLHHWPNQRAGIDEMKRLAKKRIVIVTIDSRVSGRMWLMADYLHEVAKLDNEIFPHPEVICDWLQCPTEVKIIPVYRDSPDWSLISFWAHPERVLDSEARAATSGFARQPQAVVQRVVADLTRDLKNGEWDRRYGQLRQLGQYDSGLRLITAKLG